MKQSNTTCRLDEHAMWITLAYTTSLQTTNLHQVLLTNMDLRIRVLGNCIESHLVMDAPFCVYNSTLHVITLCFQGSVVLQNALVKCCTDFQATLSEVPLRDERMNLPSFFFF